MNLNNNIEDLQSYLEEQQWISENEKVRSAEVPGDGNMNFTLRIKTDKRSFILKQSRPYVEKYPQVAAPEDRCLREAEFYELISSNEALGAMTPSILQVDKKNHILSMEDLGSGADFTRLYSGSSKISRTSIDQLIDFLVSLHTEITKDNAAYVIKNKEMRALNHEHMYHYPFIDNGMNLDDILPGLQEVAVTYRADEVLKKEITRLGDLYLADGDVLLHGDYFPGSWLETDDGIKIIDPEFCFFGFPEFELGVITAHLYMADQAEEDIRYAIERYSAQASLDEALMWKCAGVEMMRRILGLAQLPLTLSLEQRSALLSKAKKYILQ